MTADTDWHERGNCYRRNVPVSVMFPGQGDTIGMRKAKEVCVGCPVKGVCLDFAIVNRIKFGVFGGLSEKQRTRLRREMKLGRGPRVWIDRGVAS